MKFIILLSLYLTTILLSMSYTYAGVDDYIHPVAHIAGSYMLTHAGEVVCTKVTDWSKTTCSIVSGLAVTGIGLVIESQQNESTKAHSKSLLENTTGVVLAIGVIHLDF